jgi:TniQ
MNATPTTWPICPRPKSDESLHSWVERVGYEYMMTPALLVGAIERVAFCGRAVGDTLPSKRLLDPLIAERVAVLGRLSDLEISRLWPLQSGWELHNPTFSTFCPHCCLSDLGNDQAPYGRQAWQQSWCTVCLSHGSALTLRNIRIAPKNQSAWSRKKLTSDWQFLAANRYRGLKVRSQPQVRATVLGCLLEIEKATKAAIAGIAPNSWSWGSLSADEFLLVLRDLTTWTLTHFEPVRSWSIAEDLTPTEEQEGYGLIGRTHRMSGSDYRDDSSTRTLRDVTNPKVRGAALWSTHAVMATCHVAASDRPSGKSVQERQSALFSRSDPAARQWLAERQLFWPHEYRRTRWIDAQNYV